MASWGCPKPCWPSSSPPLPHKGQDSPTHPHPTCPSSTSAAAHRLKVGTEAPSRAVAAPRTYTCVSALDASRTHYAPASQHPRTQAGNPLPKWAAQRLREVAGKPRPGHPKWLFQCLFLWQARQDPRAGEVALSGARVNPLLKGTFPGVTGKALPGGWEGHGRAPLPCAPRSKLGELGSCPTGPPPWSEPPVYTQAQGGDKEQQPRKMEGTRLAGRGGSAGNRA